MGMGCGVGLPLLLLVHHLLLPPPLLPPPPPPPPRASFSSSSSPPPPPPPLLFLLIAPLFPPLRSLVPSSYSSPFRLWFVLARWLCLALRCRSAHFCLCPHSVQFLPRDQSQRNEKLQPKSIIFSLEIKTGVT